MALIIKGNDIGKHVRIGKITEDSIITESGDILNPTEVQLTYSEAINIINNHNNTIFKKYILTEDLRLKKNGR